MSVELPKATLHAGSGLPSTSMPGEASGFVVPLHPLYSSGQVGAAAFFGGPLGAAGVLALNYRHLRSTTVAWLALGLGVIATVALLAISMHLPDSFPSFILPVAYMTAIVQFTKQTQGAKYQQHLELGGTRGSNWVVTGMSVGALALTVGALVGYVVVTTSYDQVNFGKLEIIYTEGGTEAEARSLGPVMAELIYTDPTAAASLVVRRDGDRHVVGFVLQDDAFTDLAIHAELRALGPAISERAFAGAPVDLWVLDGELEPHVKIEWREMAPDPR